MITNSERRRKHVAPDAPATNEGAASGVSVSLVLAFVCEGASMRGTGVEERPMRVGRLSNSGAGAIRRQGEERASSRAAMDANINK